MKFSSAVDFYIEDARGSGRINSDSTERSYRSILRRHAEDVGNRDPRTVGREEVKRTLKRWPKPNSQRVARAMLVSFYDYCVEEGWIKYNMELVERLEHEKARKAVADSGQLDLLDGAA